ncbi:hypothetical protein [Bradyrhizobium sp. SZCCHNRI1009]|uniref:hypothetical protein n=1 Tax=Bradyrhizobium sp. SZCCHNRI1009 TaxID=3057277 RepID=UPI002915CEAE|nr:hypothetical protein [Bradyrhizobium sp. SZCCHNRI1009]
MGVIYAKASIARVGSLDWLFREYKQTKAYLEKVSKRSWPSYEHSMQAVCDLRNKKGERIGSLPIKSITPRAANSAGESVLFRRGEKFVGLCRKAWRVVHRLYPAEFAVECEREGQTNFLPHPLNDLLHAGERVGLADSLGACRHGGMTELEEAELAEGQGRALSAPCTRESYAGYAKRTASRLAATRKRRAHILASTTQTEFQNAVSGEFQNNKIVKM